VNVVKGVGFACIVFGTLVYNKLIFKKYLSPEEPEALKITTTDPNLSLLSERD
jgi:hypothetical protein